MHWQVSMWPMGIVTIGTVLLIVLAISVLIWPPSARDRDVNEAARRILAERFARGELDGEEYAKRMTALR